VHHPTALLHLCRLTYLETAHLPVSLATHNFYAPASSGPPDLLDPTSYFAHMTPQQRPLIRSVRLYAAVPALLDGALDALCANDAVRNVETLNLVVRWCDWNGWRKNEPLTLASRPSTAAAADDDDDDVPPPPLEDPAQQELEFASPIPTAASAAPPPPPRHPDLHAALSASISQLPHLKTVRLSLEAPYVKADELAAQVAGVLGWKLGLRGAEAEVQRRFEWEAPMCAWSDFCAHCGGGVGNEKACGERKGRRGRGRGPRVLGVVVRWG
jgi:hypothetical protein